MMSPQNLQALRELLNSIQLFMEKISKNENLLGNPNAINGNLGIIHTILSKELEGQPPSWEERRLYEQILQLPPLLDSCIAYYTKKTKQPWTYSKDFIELLEKILRKHTLPTSSELTSVTDSNSNGISRRGDTGNYSSGELLSGVLSVHNDASTSNSLNQLNLGSKGFTSK